MEFFVIQTLIGLSYGLLLFMLSSGLTLIFSMMGVLNFAHASFYMLGAYFAYQVMQWIGYWPALLVAPLVVGVIGALVEKHGLRRVHKFGHVPELLFTFGLTSPSWDFAGIDNYVRAIHDPVFWLSFRNNLIIVFGSIVTQIGFGTLLAAILDRLPIFRG